MLPLKDMTAPNRITPVVFLIIIANLLAFLFELSLSPSDLKDFIYTFGVIPARFISAEDGPLLPDSSAFLSLLTSMFLHGGWTHFFGNMLYLWIFGKNVEARLGSVRFLLFYLLCGIGAGMAHILFNYGSNVPTLGASGAIAGVLGAYIVTFPQSRILTLAPFLLVIEIPAAISIGIWFISQVFNAATAITDPRHIGGVAWWAHVGGFVIGIFLMKLLQPPRSATWDFEDYYGRYR